MFSNASLFSRVREKYSHASAESVTGARVRFFGDGGAVTSRAAASREISMPDAEREMRWILPDKVRELQTARARALSSSTKEEEVDGRGQRTHAASRLTDCARHRNRGR